MRCLPPRVDENPDTLFVDLTRANVLQAFCESAEFFLGRLEQGTKILALWGLACECAVSHLGLTKFPTLSIPDLTRANDSQACCESAELFRGPLKQGSKILALWGSAYAFAASHLGWTKFPTLFLSRSNARKRLEGLLRVSRPF